MQLCHLTEKQFTQAAPDCGQFLFAKLDAWRWGKCRKLDLDKKIDDVRASVARCSWQQ